jgi:chorismate mutase/prephenate dehydratase
MAKLKSSSDTPCSESHVAALAALRQKIDQVDQKLVKLMNQRAELAQQVGAVKDAENQAVYSPAREEEVFARVAEMNSGPMAASALRAVFRELISGSRAVEKALRIAFLGPAYSYSHLAALERFGQSVEMVPVDSIPAVFEEVHHAHSDFGVVPLENSTDGRIADTLDMFARSPERICGEVQLRIHHNLLSKVSRAEVKRVYSRPQALSQCRNWLGKHLPGVETVEVASTSTAARLAAGESSAAAIASQQAGHHYGLKVLASNIEDNQANVTRFAVIGEGAARRSGHDKTALMLELAHRPGGLADALNIFKRNNLNLTWIESFPIPQRRGNYLFFIEIKGHVDEEPVQSAIASLAKKTHHLELLGSYPESHPID